MALVRKTVEMDQDQLNRIKVALKVKTDKGAINFVLKQFDTDINGDDLIRHMQGRGTVNFSTDEIMALTRGDD